jgi:uncharacterized membrane-anchored protein YitT (DUF2179 family)
MKPYDKPAKRALITMLCVLSGNALLAFLVDAFIIPHDIIMGGTTGIGIVLHKAIPQMDVSLFVLILNAILLLIGLFTLGKKFAVTTVASSFLYPVLLGFFQRIPGIDTMTDNALIAAVFAGTLMGVALGLVMRVGSSTGGMDIVTLVLNKYTHMPVSIWVYITDFIVIGGQALFNPAEKTLLGIIVLVLETIVLDKAMILGKSQIQIFVISEAYEQIRQALMEQTEAGVTMTLIETGWLKKQQQGVLCVIPQRKLYAATELIQRIDPQAFITITQIREVRGQGFTIEPQNIEQAI